ncbi:MAG: ABC transporter ATP-binding protein [Oscillospiraceae bacterium]|nr:ABC transporter ATP-binding protein [Oscillospiraceae bacterium]
MSNILSAKHISKNYGQTHALRSINLDIAEGKIVGLLGPNGSGKTTLIKIINGLLLDYDGELTICEHKPGMESKSIVSYLPDREILPGWMKVSQAVDMYADFYKDFDKVRAFNMLRTLNVDDKKRVRQLSKGMREKLHLTLVMSRRARLYILDEPIAGVDPAAREVILNTILTNFNEGSSILLSTHLVSDVESVFDEVIFLKEGAIVLHDSVDAVREKENKSLDELFREVFRC